MSFRSITTLIGAAFILVVALALSGSFIENVDANELAVFQYPRGSLRAVTAPGIYWQGFGKVTPLKRRDTYDFEYQVRFNDGGHGTMHGSVQFELPLGESQLIQLVKTYGTQEGIRDQLVKKVVDRSLFFTGPLMSSTESYASKRNYLINWTEDQIANGIYRTASHDVKMPDPITGQEKTVTVVEIVMSNGQPQRQEAATLQEYGVKTSNFTITNIKYEDSVEAQIKQQQQLSMAIQTSIANAKLAEQAKVTTEENGKAKAAQAKWDQEILKAKAVTEAEQQKEVAALNAQAAEQYKRQQILIGEGDGERKRLTMQADGALEQKLRTYVETQKYWADALAKHQGSFVPSVYMGGGGTGAPNGAFNFMELLGAKAAKDLSLDLSVPQGRK